MDNVSQRRKWASRLLLAVFIPMLMLSSLHQHNAVVSAISMDCQECVHHIHHDGHFTSQSVSLDNCVLCQFLSLPYLAAAAVSISLLSHYHYVTRQQHVSACMSTVVDIHSTRAPPYVL